MVHCDSTGDSYLRDKLRLKTYYLSYHHPLTHTYTHTHTHTYTPRIPLWRYGSFIAIGG